MFFGLLGLHTVNISDSLLKVEQRESRFFHQPQKNSADLVHLHALWINTTFLQELRTKKDLSWWWGNGGAERVSK